MSLPLPLSVRLVTGRGDRHVTRDLRSLRFRETAQGGYAWVRFALDRPLLFTPDEIAYYGRCIVYDTRNGKVVCEGRLEDPGRGAGSGGTVWQLAAMGPSTHAQDYTGPLIYVDRRTSEYVRVENVTPGADFSITADPGVSGSTVPLDQSLVYRFPQGLTLATNSRVAARYDGLRQTGQRLGRYDYTWDAGLTAAALSIEAFTRTDGGAGESSRTQTANVAGGGSLPKLIVTDFPAGRNTVDLRLIYTGGAGTIANDLNWASISNPVVVATRYNKAGTELLTAADYPNSTVLASQVVADLLGRGWLAQYDGANARIDTTTFPIERLAWLDGISPAAVFAALLEFEPGFRWGAYESNDAGLHRFEFVEWPDTVRYECTAYDDIDMPGSAAGLFNEVGVRYIDVAGRPQTTTRTASVPALTAAGLTRRGWRDLGTETGGSANATQAGDQWLAEHNAAPNAGRLVVSGRVLDLHRGRMVDPWEIKAGELIRVAGIRPRIDALNASARDGVTVFRIAARDFDSSTASATLELDSYARTTAHMLAATHPAAGARPYFFTPR